MTESQLTRLLCSKLEAMGASVLPVVGGQFGRSGWPDRFIAYKGGQVWIEFKAASGRLSAEQRSVLHKLQDNGARVYVGWWLDDGTLTLTDLNMTTVAVCPKTIDLLEFICPNS